MLIQKTHFEQVPLEVVRKILKEQILREVSTRHVQAIDRNTADEIPLEVRDQPVAEPAPSFSRRYSSNAEAQSQKIPRRFQRGN
jgi:hypothetical protein